MNRRHTLFALLMAFGLVGCETGEPEPLDLEAVVSADGISLTPASVQSLEEWAATGGFTDTRTRLRVIDADGKVLREVNGESFEEALGGMAVSPVDLEELQRQADVVVAGLKSGDIPLPEREAAVKAFGDLFEALEKLEQATKEGDGR